MNLIFTWNDLKRIVQSKQKIIVRLSILCALITFLYLLKAPLQYEAWATFKQSPSRGDQGFDIKNLIRSFSSGGSEGTSTTLMLSDTVLEKTAQKLGLQAELKNSRRGGLFRSVAKNILAEIGILTEDAEIARFSSVAYQGEKPLKMTLKRISESEFYLFDDRKRFLTKGAVGEPVAYGEFQLTLNNLPIKDEAILLLHPIQPITHNLRKKLTIKPTREDKNLLLIKCLDQNRARSAEIVNTLMAMYEKYLVDENKIIIGAQLSYLNQRQDELSARLDQDIQDHAKALQSNLQTQGFLGIKDEMEYVLEPLQKHKTRLDEIQLELRQVDQHIAKANRETKLTKSAPGLPGLIDRYSKMLAEQMISAKKVLSHVHRKEKIPEAPIEELKPAIEEFNLALENPDSQRLFKIEALLHEFMNHLNHREKSLRESSQWIQTAQNDLSGISLDAARRQFNQYSTQFDDLHAQLKQVLFMRDRLFDPHFEISTLSNVLGDSVTQQMVQRSSELEAQLHDDLHRSVRDRERFKATLAIHKRFLESHLDQTLQLGKIRIDLLKEKLSSLYTVMRTLLMQEQEIVAGKITELQASMQSLPQLWVHENRLKFKSDLTKGMMEGLVSIAETKNLAHHLYQVESKPLDKAKPPLGFIKPLLVAKSTLAFFLGVIILAALAIIHALIKGFPISLATLKEIGAHTSGPLSLESPLLLESAKDADRETLRRITSFLLDEEGRKCVAVIGEKQTFFFPALTQLLKKHQKTSCVIDCSFGKIISSEDTPGLFQILNGASNSEVASSFPSYDYISAGASSPDGVELLKSSAFERLAAELSSRYDFIFFLSRTPIHALESDILLSQCTHAIIVAESTLEDIKPYLDPARQKENKYVTFVQYV